MFDGFLKKGLQNGLFSNFNRRLKKKQRTESFEILGRMTSKWVETNEPKSSLKLIFLGKNPTLTGLY